MFNDFKIVNIDKSCLNNDKNIFFTDSFYIILLILFRPLNIVSRHARTCIATANVFNFSVGPSSGYVNEFR